jgi:hypothetical protein
MRQKSTDIVEGQDFHRQFHKTPDQIKIKKQKEAERARWDEKQGQSEFRVEKIIKKK